MCKSQPAIGVASTSIPFSCAYCVECARHGADPEWIFEYFKDEGYKPDAIRKELCTFKDGKYLTYKEWYT